MKYIILEAQSEIIDEIIQATESPEDIVISKPKDTESLADVLDAPLSGEEVKEVMKNIYVASRVGTESLLRFALSAVRILKNKQSEQLTKITVKNPESGKTFYLSQNSTKEDILSELS